MKLRLQNWYLPATSPPFDGAFRELPGDLLQAKALDDRAGCALLLELVRSVPECDITLAFTVQEEIGLRGAKTAAFAIKPDIAVVVDATTAADIAGVKGDKRVCCIGSGPVVSFMDKRTLYDKPLYDWIRCQAEEEDIPAQTKSLVAGGNDAGAIQLAGSGARVAARFAALSLSAFAGPASCPARICGIPQHCCRSWPRAFRYDPGGWRSGAEPSASG